MKKDKPEPEDDPRPGHKREDLAEVARGKYRHSDFESLEERAKRGKREKFEAALAKLPDVEPEEYDKL